MITISSFLFLLILLHIDYGVTTNSCYSSNGDPLPCEPPLENLGRLKPIIADSVCGNNGPENVCTKWTDHLGNLQNTCEICDNSVPGQTHSPERILDYHVTEKETCWYSEAYTQQIIPTNVNLTIDLKKRSLISYITLELCGEQPSGIIINKRSAESDEWLPWQYFGKNCEDMFGMEEITPETMERIPYNNRLQPVCFSLDKSIEYGEGSKLSRLLPFNPTHGRRFERILTLEEQDWLTASNVRFTYVLESKHTGWNYLSEVGLSSKMYLGASNVVIGGRSLCNGHSHRVISTIDDNVKCECHHSTTGVDCEMCHEEFNDQPWTPAFGQKASICKRCECNNHATKCSFDVDVYIKNNRKHGSKCKDCADNTTGAQCDKCSPGFYRNHIYPIYHKKACTPCSCHSVGSYLDRPCDTLTGTCFCKPGVTGTSCNECVQGFQQTNSLEKPCRKGGTRKFVKSSSEKCQFCQQRPRKINSKRFCKKELSMRVSVKSQENRGHWIRFHMSVENVWLHKDSSVSYEKIISNNQKSIKIWVRKELMECGCINLELGQSYLIMANMKTKAFMGAEELMISHKSIVEEWNEEYNEMFLNFLRFESDGKCNEYRRQKRNARRKSMAYSLNQYAYYNH